MTDKSKPHRLLPAIMTVLALVTGCATANRTTPTAVDMPPKEDPPAGIERQRPPTADHRAWIENACPRDILGPDPWKRCMERNLQALQAGLPDLTGLASADRAWIENSCPRDVIGPGPWKRCAERNLQALQAGLPDLSTLTSADRTWIEDSCPRDVIGPGPWKRCAERNLQALQAGLPDLSTLTSADRAWIEDACPRDVIGPGPWKQCAERNLQALQAGLPDTSALASSTSQNRLSASRDDQNAGRGSITTTREESRPIAEETTSPESTARTTANTRPAPPRLAAPLNGERWFCYSDPLSTLFDQSPHIVLTREGETAQPFGKGRVLVADVIYDTTFQIEGIDRRWDWSDGKDSISISSSGDGAYFNFRLLEPGKTRLPPTQQLWCNQK